MEERKISLRINYGNLISRSTKSINNKKIGLDNQIKYGYSRRSIDYSDES